MGGSITRGGLSSRQKGVVKAHVARQINSESKHKTSKQILDNLVASVANDEDDRAVLRNQIKSYIYRRFIQHENDDASVASGATGATGATDISFMNDDFMEVLASKNFGRAFDKDLSFSSDDEGDPEMPALGTGEVTSNLATPDDRKLPAKRGHAEIAETHA